jgi:surfeit locus 1 family protein
MAFCDAAIPPFDGVLLDRGVVEAFTGLMAPRPKLFSDPAEAIGILRAPGATTLLDSAALQRQDGAIVVRIVDAKAIVALAHLNGVAHPAPYLVAVESEQPAPPGVAPAALPQDIPNNHLGYALTWFGLAAALVGVTVGMIRRRLVDS